MRNAFNIRPVLKQLPVRIEAAATYGDRLLLGTANGALLVYRVAEPAKERQLAVTLIETKRAFARRAIEQLEVIKEAGVLICLADGVVTLYDLHTLSDATPLSNTKGANVIAVHTAVDHIDGIPTLVSKLAVHTRRKVVVLEWRDAEFYKSFEYSAADKIAAMQFSSPRLLTLSTAREFLTLQLPEGQWDDLFPADTASLRTLAGGLLSDPSPHGGTGSSSSGHAPTETAGAPSSTPAAASPSSGGGSMWGSWSIGLSGSSGGYKTIIARMPGEKLLLCHEDVGVFINAAGKLCRQDYSDPMAFARSPKGITYTSSYVVAISQSSSSAAGATNEHPSASSGSPAQKFNVEVRNIGTQAPVQSLYLPEEEPTQVFNGSGGKQVWAFGPHTVWRLMPVPIQQQVEDVLKAGQYDEASSLVAQSDNILEAEKDELTLKIRWLRARWLFREQAQYEEALGEFSELGATPTEAIALCPERISGDLAEEFSDSESGDSGMGPVSSSKPESSPDLDAAAKRTEQTKTNAKAKANANANAKAKQVVWKDALFALMRYLTEHRRWLQQAISINKRELEYVVRVLDDDDDDDDDNDDDNDDDGDDREDEGAKGRAGDAVGVESTDSTERSSYGSDSLPHVRLKRLRFSLERMKIPVAAMAQVVDTTLLKVYLECSPGLLGPLLRVKNHCDVEQSERLLLEHKRYSELVDLYHGKGLYRNALQLLQSRGKAADGGALQGTYPTVRYLLRLPADQFELVLEYVRWPLQNDRTSTQSQGAAADEDAASASSNEDWPDGASVVSMVFADDRPAAEAFPRARVASFLRQISSKLVVQYLAYVFDEWDDPAPALHDDMVAAYLDLVGSTHDSVPAQAVLEEEQQHEPHSRQGLQQFLRTSRHYSPERALARLPDDGLFEERALVLSRLGRHQQALSLLVFSVAKPVLAEQYCTDNVGSCADVFVLLLKVLVSDPPADVVDNEAQLIRAERTPSPTDSGRDPAAQIERIRRDTHRRFAGHLVSTHHRHIPAPQALRLLPSDMEFTHDMFRYLRGQFCALDQDMRAGSVIRSLRVAEDLQARRHLRTLQSSSVVVSETRTCPQCLKRIGAGTAFAVVPSRRKGTAPAVVHYSCWQRHSVLPPRGPTV
ncbi:hypothetical protein GQ54DRAFT_316864 [Martensiomyces pterosporus]|nr:hypothetical protein GQ54DRAFT_316864 [Martensiomyces pterosporus]